MGSKRGNLKVHVARANSPGVRKKTGANPGVLRGEALQGMLVLAAATQHAEGHPEHGGGAVAAVAGAQQQQQQQQQPRRHESASSDNEYSEGQYAPPPAQQQQQRTGQRGHVESEEEKKEKRRLANREAARRMRRRRATHMAAVEEEVERLSQENSLLLHRLSQLVASHQVVDGENQQLRAELLALRQSVGACLQVGQADLAGASLPALAADATPTAGAVLPPQRLPVAAEGELAAAAAAPNGAALSLRVNGGVARPPAVRPVPGAAAALPPTALEGLSARLGMPSSSGGHSTENEMTATEEERARYQAGVERDLSFGSSGEGALAAPAVAMGRTARKRGTWKPLDE